MSYLVKPAKDTVVSCYMNILYTTFSKGYVQDNVHCIVFYFHLYAISLVATLNSFIVFTKPTLIYGLLVLYCIFNESSPPFQQGSKTTKECFSWYKCLNPLPVAITFHLTCTVVKAK